VAFRTAFNLNLGFDYEPAFVIVPELTPNREGFFRVECDIASWYGDVVGTHKMSGLILVESDVAQRSAYKLSNFSLVKKFQHILLNSFSQF